MSAEVVARRLAAAALIGVFVLAGVLALRQVSSLDAGFHLRAGEYILTERTWPRTDPFTYTVNDHPYVDTSWGYQVLLALTHRVVGASGLTVLHVGLVLGTFGLLGLTARLRSTDPLGMAGYLALAVLASEMRFEVRPEGLSLLFLAGVLYLLHRHVVGERAPLALLPAIFWIWANCHSLIVLGFIAVGCFVVGTAIAERKLDRPLAGWSAASVAAALINPYGLRALTFPFDLVSRMRDENVFGQTIGEFVPPLSIQASEQYPFVPVAPLTSFKLLLLIVVVSGLRLLWTRRYAAALLVPPAVFLALQMVRNLPLLAVFCTVGAIWALPPGPAFERLFRQRAALAKSVAAGGLIVLLGLLGLRVVHDAYYIDTRRDERFGLGWNPAVQPVAAARYVDEADPPGRMLNHLNFGGYLMWALDEPVFIDGRLEVMGEAFFERYRVAMGSPEGLAAAVRRHDVGYVVFPHKLASRLLGRLSRDPGWRLGYVDPLAAVFVRRGPPVTVDRSARLTGAPPLAWTPEGLPGFGSTPPPARGVAAWLDGVLRPAVFPREPFGMGLFHYFRGEMDHAAAHFAEAIRASDGAYYEMYNNLGSSLARLGRLDEAATCYELALAAAPDSPAIRERLAELRRRIAAD